MSLGLWTFLIAGLAQNITINGISNHYLRVDQVLTNRVQVTETVAGEFSSFSAERIVMLIQMTGVTISTPPNFEVRGIRTKESFRNAGKYEILQVDQVIPISGSSAWIYFTHDIAGTYDAGEKIQLVSFAEGETVTVAGSDATARIWDGEVGGIVAIIGTDSVKLNTNIDVSGTGFRGGVVPTEEYSGGCRYVEITEVNDTLYWIPTKINRSGNKGEGVVTATWPYTKGTAFGINGGGAGNGLYSGGGGGSNYRSGGDGGQQSSACTGTASVNGGWGGYACLDLIKVVNNHQIIMGGGGGSGTRLASATPAPGGTGAGIVIIITGTLKRNGGSIIASGQSAVSTTGSGGGGGAGGTILIDATDYAGGSVMNINIRGGNGSSTNAACTGSGGGGSGGLLWHSGNAITAAIDSTRGLAGAACIEQKGSNGDYGARLKNLLTPLTGFLFNSIKGTDTVCAGLAPGALTASQPKGGDGTYSHTWQQSTNNINWLDVAGLPPLRTYQPGALNQTTWFRRIVSSAGIIDTSRAIKIFVYPAIANNTITGTDTICYNSNAQPIHGVLPTGGNNTFTYIWQDSEDQAIWTVVDSAITFDPDLLTASTYYRRIVNSTKYCTNTSNTVMIKVLPSISRNMFNTNKADTAICMNTSPGQLNILSPAGGDDSYSYLWQHTAPAGSWTNIPGGTAMNLTVGVLTVTTSYRRIVFSGNDDACIDTSDAKAVITMPLISNNSIIGDPVQYTCYNTPAPLPGSQPSGGFGAGTYAYQWEQSNDNSVWNAVTGGINQNFQSSNLIATRYFRRTVYSTPIIHECADVSDAVEVRINPLPTGNVVNKSDKLCAGDILYVKFTVNGNGPFAVQVRGENIAGITKTNVAGPIDSIAFSPATTQAFTVVTMLDDSSCYADVNSFAAIVPATVYAIPIANAGIDSAVCGTGYTLQAVKNIAASSGLWTGTDVTFDNPSGINQPCNCRKLRFTCINVDRNQLAMRRCG